MHWIGPRDQPAPNLETTLPLVVFEAPCVLRSAATTALDKAGIPWRVALTSPSVGGIWAAVAAGMGVTVRTRIGLPAHLMVLEGLPQLAKIGYVLHRAQAESPPVVSQLAELVIASLAEQDYHSR